MKFSAKYGHGFSDEGEVFEAPVVARHLNGYTVKSPVSGEEFFLCSDDIDILSISDEEKNMQIQWNWDY